MQAHGGESFQGARARGREGEGEGQEQGERKAALGQRCELLQFQSVSLFSINNLRFLGIVLWGGMTEECDDFYGANHGLLLGVFHLQVPCRISAACPAISDVRARILTTCVAAAVPGR